MIVTTKLVPDAKAQSCLEIFKRRTKENWKLVLISRKIKVSSSLKRRTKENWKLMMTSKKSECGVAKTSSSTSEKDSPQ